LVHFSCWKTSSIGMFSCTYIVNVITCYHY
jgi:hypothetical protein